MVLLAIINESSGVLSPRRQGWEGFQRKKTPLLRHAPGGCGWLLATLEEKKHAFHGGRCGLFPACWQAEIPKPVIDTHSPHAFMLHPRSTPRVGGCSAGWWGAARPLRAARGHQA